MELDIATLSAVAVATCAIIGLLVGLIVRLEKRQQAARKADMTLIKEKLEQLTAAYTPEFNHQDALRKAELESIKIQVNNHLPTLIANLEKKSDKMDAKLDRLLMYLIPKPKDDTPHDNDGPDDPRRL